MLFWTEIYSVQVIFIYKRFNLILHDLMQLLERIENIVIFFWLDFLFLFCFLFSQDNLFMIHDNLDLFFDIYNTIIEHNQRKIHYPLLILIFFWNLYSSESKSSFLTLHASSFIMISMLVLFECITRSSSLSIEIKLFAIVKWIFNMSDFWRLFIMSFKYG